jgi:hypothetical protein
MEQHTAVKKMMLSIRIEEIIPKEVYPLIREYLQQMYAVGYDQGRSDSVSFRKKAVAQYNSEGTCVNIFKGLRESVRQTGYAYDNLRRAIINNRPYRGFWWKYVTDDDAQELREANRDKYMY